jgi:hypothetical protein
MDLVVVFFVMCAIAWLRKGLRGPGRQRRGQRIHAAAHAGRDVQGPR